MCQNRFGRSRGWEWPSPVLDAVGGLLSLLANSNQEGCTIQGDIHRQDAVLLCCRVEDAQAMITHNPNLHDIHTCTGSSIDSTLLHVQFPCCLTSIKGNPSKEEKHFALKFGALNSQDAGLRRRIN